MNTYALLQLADHVAGRSLSSSRDFEAPANEPAARDARAGTVPGLPNVQTDRRLTAPELMVSLGGDRAEDGGVPARETATTLPRPSGGRDVRRYTSSTTPQATGGIMNRHFWRHTVPAALVALSGTAVAPATAAAQAVPGATRTVTLGEARRRASTTDPSAIAARGQIETALWERRAAFTDLVAPTLTGESNYTRFSDPFLNVGTGSISSSATSATLNASYTVLGAGKTGELRRARASVDNAEATETATRFRVALASDAAYYAVLADRELSRVAADRLRRAEEQLGIARARVVAGETIASDSLQLLLEVNRARLAVLRADSAVVASRLRLGRRIGLDGPVDAAPLEATGAPPLPLTQAEAVAEMRRRGPEVEAARATERSAAAALSAEREAYLPEIRIGGSTGAYDSRLFPSALRRSQMAVTVSLPIWTGGQRELAVARARVERDVARADREDRERATAEQMAGAYQGYETARAATDLAVVAVAVAAENYRVQRVRYAEGETTILDLLEAQVALSESDASLVQARYATRLAQARIEALLGRRLFETAGTPSRR